MMLSSKSYPLQFISPCFCRGYDGKTPEIRATSIRGQLRHWLRSLAYKNAPEIESGIFGSVFGKDGKASKVAIRVENEDFKVSEYRVLWHEGKKFRQKGISPGTRFTVYVIKKRLLDKKEDELLENTIKAWSLLGGIGMRATRGLGSFSGMEKQTLDDYNNNLNSLLEGRPITAVALPKIFRNYESALADCTNTIGGPSNEKEACKSLAKIRYPLGMVRDNKRNAHEPSRKTSPLRLTLRRFEDGIRIIAVWDGREEVTGNRTEDLQEVIRLLKEAGKPLGTALESVQENLLS